MSQQYVSIPVPGVACAGHSVERALFRVTGVVSVYVNGANEVAEIKYDDQCVTVQRLCEAIRRCGFHAGLPQVPGAPSSRT